MLLRKLLSVESDYRRRGYLIMNPRSRLEGPQGLKPASLLAPGGTAEEAAEKLFEGVRSSPQALKRKHIFDGLAARLEVVPFPFPVKVTLSSACEAVPFPKPFMR
jgi:hypothetical protein